MISHRARLLLGSAAAIGLALWSQNAAAQDGTIQVSALVQAACSVVSGGTTLDFGVYDPADPGGLQANTSFDIECSAPIDVAVSLDGGNNDDGLSRRLSNGGPTPALLFYNLYQDSARNIKFGDDTGLGQTKTVPVNGSPVEVPVFGSILNGQPVPAGDYEDVVNITLSVT